MSKLKTYIRIILKAIAWVAVSLVLIFILIAVLIQIPSIQTKIVHFATTFISDKTHTKVEIKNVGISFPKSVVIENRISFGAMQLDGCVFECKRTYRYLTMQ